MGLIILIWIMVAHCIYMPLAVNSTNNVSDETELGGMLTTQYAICILWPFVLSFVILCFLFVCITALGILKDRFGEYVMDIYWDIVAFYIYVQTMFNTDRKP